MLFSKKDVMRSGYLHNHPTYSFIVRGKVELWTLEQEGTSKKVYKAHEFITVNPYVPHILHFLEDSTILEFWEGKFQCWYYHPYRRLVQLQNELVANKGNEGTLSSTSSIGQFQRLVPADLGDAPASTASALLWMTAGMIVGGVATFASMAFLGGHMSSRGGGGGGGRK